MPINVLKHAMSVITDGRVSPSKSGLDSIGYNTLLKGNYIAKNKIEINLCASVLLRIRLDNRDNDFGKSPNAT